MKFSIIVVCLNAGEKLKATLDSIWRQDYEDYEVVVKDGCSTDGSPEAAREAFSAWEEQGKLRIVTRRDEGIYDAMNQAVAHVRGEYIFFLNCGDKFHDAQTLSKTAEIIDKREETDGIKDARSKGRYIFYGKIFGEKNQVWITPAPKITGFTCYRNVPCHQACFYSAALCREKPFEQKYRIRGDYEHFLWCFYRGGAQTVCMDTAVADYEGGGYSETKENKKRSREEHREITREYMSGGELFRYRAVMLCTLAPLRTFMAENRYLSGLYNGIKSMVYGGGRKKPSP